MAAMTRISAGDARVPIPDPETLPDDFGLSLHIFELIPPDCGVLAITGEDVGSPLLPTGEVAVYDGGWRDRVYRGQAELQPGLYVYERQRPPASMPNYMIADRFRDNDPVTMDIEREVVFVFRHPRNPECWAYRQLRSRLHRGVRMMARTEGPWYPDGLLAHLRGPVVGVYRPRIEGRA
jgi:hypothetical protein